VNTTLRFSAGLVLFLGVACSSPPPPWTVGEDEPAAPRRYETLGVDSEAELLDALELYESGDFDAARSALDALARDEPEDIRVAIWYQESQLAWAEDRARRLETPIDQPRQTLRDRYRREADSDRTPLAWVLAARLEDDGPAATLLLERALELDPAMSWAHYGLAFVAARAGDLAEVTAQLERTFELEPDHLPALRLYAWALAQTGDSGKAAEAFTAWLGQSRRDFLATDRIRSAVMLDLALVHLADGDADRAQELIETLDPGSVDEARRLAALAAAQEARGRPMEASEAAAAALRADPEALLPAVQQALLLELWLGDVAGARRAWRKVLEISAGRDDLAAGLQRFRAQLHLLRLREEPRGRVP